MPEGFDTTTRKREPDSRSFAAGSLSRHRPRIAVACLVVALLAGGAFYASRVSERAPQVVYTASLEEVAAEERGSLTININTADEEELDELPEVGPATAEAIVEYRLANGRFSSVDDLDDVSGIGPVTLEKIKPFATV
ncbi:MAG: helix-hairpin-helix domain-containing protein [Rubrobacteraceae bacterium]